MIVLGLTGSIGMGKSTVARMLERLGCPVHNADKAVHQALSPYGAAFEEVAVTFPAAWDKKTHTIKRNILAEIIFNNDENRKELEKILHPVVRKDQHDFLRHHKKMGRKIAALEIPLLFETGAQSRVDYVLVASAPYEIQRRRVLKRPNMSEEKFHAILNTQMPDAEKRARADYVVPTGLGMAYSFKELQKILREMKADA